MKERPILFSGEMVRAILEGKKTQTRRIVKPQPDDGPWPDAASHIEWSDLLRDTPYYVACGQCPHGRIDDRLWMKEKCAIGFSDDDDLVCDYHADGQRRRFVITEQNQKYALRYINDDWRRSSICMPRWACRVVLQVTAVRVERLQEITEDDARAEGISGLGIDDNGYDLGNPDHWIGFRHRFWWLWDKLHAKRGYDWRSNPWVWVIEFERI